MKLRKIYILLAAAMPVYAFAADGEVISNWKGEAELGFISTSGNTDTETFSAKAKVINERAKWKHTGIAESTRTADKGLITAQRYLISAKSDYKFNDSAYMFGLLNYEENRFSGYKSQSSLIIGYGHKLVTSATIKLEAELGYGTRNNVTLAGVSADNGILYGSMDLNWKISDSSSFSEKITVENGSDATITKAVTSLTAKINSKLVSKITYTIKNTSDVPVGFEETDSETAITLVYSF